MNSLIIVSLFWGSVALIAYAYVGYPLLVWLLSKQHDRRVKQYASTEPAASQARDLPLVSIIIAAYREENVILYRLNNLVLLDYPPDKLEILIGCHIA